VAFLTWLAAERDVAGVTQNQALNALVFLFKEVGGRLAATPQGSTILSCDDPVGACATTGYKL
jgi:hypothetical protein